MTKRKKAKKLRPLVACVVVETYEHYESNTLKPIRMYGWSAGIGVQTLPIPYACIKGQSHHGDPVDALADALHILKRLGAKVVSKTIPGY